MKARLSPLGRALAVGAAVATLHAAALVLLWRHTEPAAGTGGVARGAAVSAALLPAPERRAALPQERSAPPPAPQARTPRAAPDAAAPAPAAPTGTVPVATGQDGAALHRPGRPEDGLRAPDAVPTAALEPDVVAAAAPAGSAASGVSLPADVPGGGRWTAPAPGRLEYDVFGDTKGLSYRAEAVLDWRPEGDRYRAELALRAFLVGARVQLSTGALTPRGLQPARFEDRARRERWLAFDWPPADEPGRARADDGAQLDGLPPGTQDRLGVFVQLGGWMEAADAGQRWRVPVAGLGRLEHWTFEVAGRERVVVPAGAFDTVRLRRLPDGDRGMGVELWYSPAVPGLPVRIVLQQPNGDRVDQRLRAWRPGGAPP